MRPRVLLIGKMATDTFVQLFRSLPSGLITIVRDAHSVELQTFLVKESTPCLH